MRDLAGTAEEVFGWTELRQEQLVAMEHLLDGHDVLVVMPTGAGKSAIYQVPAILLDGPTVVVSPLIALQHDQVSALRASEAPPAAAVNSAQSAEENEQAWQAFARAETEYLFLAPEQLANPETVDRLRDHKPSLFVVDEAHCVSAWGHDFRPDYLRLRHVVESLDHPPVLALTATASGPVRDDIAGHLGLRDPAVLVAGFDRPNLHLAVRHHADEDDRRKAVTEWVVDHPGPGLLYTATRKETERYAADLVARGVRAGAFHAGMKAADRRQVQDDFMSGALDVVAATSAFGMGIDKPDVRFVVHAATPGSLDAYYQEIGRAGRDGEPAGIVLFHRPEDQGLQRFLTGRKLDEQCVREVAEAVHRSPTTVADLVRHVDCSRRKVTGLVNLLESAGVVRTSLDGVRYVHDAPPPAEAVAVARERADSRLKRDRSRIEVMREYTGTRGCRRRFLLGYFGQRLDEPCGHCDRCDDGLPPEDEVDAEFPPNSPVRHDQWGRGTVVHHDDDKLMVLFDEVGYKTLSLDAIRGTSILTADAS
ncbi:RecQ family ATP-dependent DNA helicase [Lentzea sp.]|uniref:RecQ family ATP-dependent DNA helicase n=1 Tax=Lentzea sp. TaxID=56099 RepID=UPI002ED19F23